MAVIAIDSSVLIDLLVEDIHAAAAETCLRSALSSGRVVICEVVVSEVTAGLGHGASIMEVLNDLGIHYASIEQSAAICAGEMQRKYRQRLERPKLAHLARTIPDFLIGAHAMLQCSGLITRDDGFFRDYFKGLKVIVPTTG